MIHFYDIDDADGKPWSPNTQRILYALVYSKRPFVRHGVPMVDIAKVLVPLGAKAHEDENEEVPYTLPAITDDEAPQLGVIMGTFAIVEHLGLWPGSDEVQALTRRYRSAVSVIREREATMFIVPYVPPRLEPRSAEYFVTSRNARFAPKTLDDFIAEQAALDHGEELGHRLFTSLADAVAEWKQGHAPSSAEEATPYCLGKEPCYIDFCIASFVFWVSSIRGATIAERALDACANGASLRALYRTAQANFGEEPYGRPAK